MGGDQAEAAQQSAWSSSRERPSCSQRGLRSGAPWRDLPDAFGPYTSCYNRFVRRRPGRPVESYIDGLATARDGALQMIDTLIVRVHQNGHATQYLCSQIGSRRRECRDLRIVKRAS